MTLTLPKFKQDGTVAVNRDFDEKLREIVSVLDFIPAVEHTAIKAGTSTYDCTVDIQAAIDFACSDGSRLFFPSGKYKVLACLNLTSDLPNLQHNKCYIFGEGKNSTILDFTSSPSLTALIETQGSDAITIKDLAMYGSSSVGIYQARGQSRQWGGNHYYENIIVYLNSNTTLNSGVGSIALLNVEGEESRYNNVELWADIPVVICPPTAMSIGTFDAACNYTGERTFNYTPTYLPVLSVAVSNTVFSFYGGCRFVSQTYDSPSVVIRSASNVDFTNTFMQKNGTGYKNPFVFDFSNAFRVFATGTHEMNNSAGGALFTNGTLDGVDIKTTTGNYDGVTNNVPLVYFGNSFVGAKIVGTKLNLRLNTNQDQLPIKTLSNVNTSIFQSCEFIFHGTASLNFIPYNLFFNAADTKVRFGPQSGGGTDYGQVTYVTRYHQKYSFNKILPYGVSTRVFTAVLPPNDAIASSINFKGGFIAGWVVGTAHTSTVNGEFAVYLARNSATLGLVSSVGKTSWGTPLNTDASQIAMAAPTIGSTNDVGQQWVGVDVTPNSTGVLSPDTLMSGEIDVVSSYGAGGYTTQIQWV